MTFTTTTPASEIELETARQVEMATAAKARSKTSRPAAICKLWHSKRRFSLGFIFPQAAVVGQVFENDDRTRQEVIAVVQ